MTDVEALRREVQEARESLALAGARLKLPPLSEVLQRVWRNTTINPEEAP